MRPLVLDLFCGAGGAGEGYRHAGFDVTGVDIDEHDYRPGHFIRGDALSALRDLHTWGRKPDLIHASPPCQRYSAATGIICRTAPLSYPKLCYNLSTHQEMKLRRTR